jgi:hypothetical protein
MQIIDQSHKNRPSTPSQIGKYYRQSSDKNVSTALAPGPIVSTFCFFLRGLAKLPSLPKFQILSIDNVYCPGEALPMAPLHPWLGSYTNPEWGVTSFRNWNHRETIILVCLAPYHGVPEKVRTSPACPRGLNVYGVWSTRDIHRRVVYTHSSHVWSAEK